MVFANLFVNTIFFMYLCGQNQKSMKQIILATFLCAYVTSAFAYDFRSGDLCYNITSDSTVEVTKDSVSYELSRIVIPSSVLYNDKKYHVTSIGELAFFLNENIKHIDVPSSVRTIDMNAIGGCSSLEVLYIGDGIESIDWNFYGCPNLQITICAKNPPKLTLYFKVEGCNTLYVPKESMYQYANTKGWEKFERIMPIGGSSSEGIFHPNYDPKNKVASVAGCKFGSGAEQAISFFNNKFKYYTERNSYEASYVDVYFAGYNFDVMKLQFAYNKQTNRDEFSSIEFQKIFNLSEYKAIEECFEDIRKMYSSKYSNEQKHSESMYFYGMIEEDYHELIPPIVLSFEKGFGRDGKERYYLVITYYTLKTSDRYLDDI